MLKKPDDIIDLLMVTRQALLTIVDAIEVFVNVKYRTSALRRDYRTLRKKMFEKKD